VHRVGRDDVDQADFGYLQRCLSTAGAPCSPECTKADLTNDGAVDQQDVTVFVTCMAGPESPPGC